MKLLTLLFVLLLSLGAGLLIKLTGVKLGGSQLCQVFKI